LTPLGYASTEGRMPRSFAILPNGLILAANQDTDTIAAFRIGSNGVPVPTGAVTHVPAPVCVLPMQLSGLHQA
ncbi:MAG: lactonase family protein, partial [Armatimonadota bacterium]|nr:lactonase family protein [Armatimonadota bacterium]